MVSRSRPDTPRPDISRDLASRQRWLLSTAAGRALLGLGELAYANLLRLRNLAYALGVLPTRHAPRPVISVGNLTAGGTGKTPMVVHVVTRLRELGHDPGVLLRGYKADGDGDSDEAEVLRRALPGVPVIARPDRVAASEQLVEQSPDVDVIVLDDGFQHRRLGRDVDLVLIDATDPFGVNHVLPRGLMREPPGGLRRADAVIVTHCASVDDEARQAVDERIARYHGRPPIAHVAHAWRDVVDRDGQPVAAGRARVLAVCGIGNPDAFFHAASRRFTVAAAVRLPDHAAYTDALLTQLLVQGRSVGADALLTTEKDWVKLQGKLESRPDAPPVWRPQLAMEFLDGAGILDDWLLKPLKATGES